VFNASPLIFLAGAGLIDLVRLAGEPLSVPRAVVEEIERFGPTDPTVVALQRTRWLNVVDPGATPAILERWDLGRGETSVLSWAYQHSGTTAVLDDLAARRCARALSIPVRGTLGLVLIAKRRQIIPAARPVLDQLRQAGMYLSDQVMNYALGTVGE
jgi:predicted nucleic acid-binding protein